MPANSIFTVRGYAIIEPTESIASTLALTSSTVFDFLAKLLLGRFGFPEFVVGVIQQLPLPTLSDAEAARLAQLARRAWSLKRTLDTVHETSHAFLLPSALRARLGAFDPAAIDAELARIQAEIDDHAFRLYGLQGEDRAEIERWASRSKSASPSTSDASEDVSPEDAAEDTDDDSAEDAASASSERDALLSWCFGVAFGRFDPRLATGERAMPPEPEPFDPLPTRSPGMWPEAEAAPSAHDILVDDPGHAHDLTQQVSAYLERVGASVPEDLRAYFARGFFPLHIKQYSKSRRKAPIYWQLATPSASYSVWLYLHAFSKDTLFRVQNDFVGGDSGKLAHEERRLDALTTELRDGATTAQRKELAAQQTLVEELRAFLDEVKRVAPLWNPNLDDGVLINFAPLYRLVPQHKSWQKELKSTWDALCDGKYDWAHLAMHLWPERVVPKCAKDRSLAIAHGLEDEFWVEGKDGKWSARQTPTRSVDELVRERTSLAVKSALKSLLEAPVASGKSTARKGSGGRKATAAAEGGDA